MSKLLKTCILILFGLTFYKGVFANEHHFLLNSQLKTDTTLNVYIVELESWGEIDNKTGQLTGIYPDIYRALAKKLPFRIKLHLAPYPRVIKLLENGQCDLSTTIASQSAKANIAHGSEFWKIQMAIYSLKEKPYKNEEQLEGKQVGIIRKAKINPSFDKNDSIIKIESNVHTNLVKMLINKRIDAIVGDVAIIETMLAKNKELAEKLSPPFIISSVPLHVLISKKSTHFHLSKQINEAFKELIKEGQIKSIVLKHLNHLINGPLSKLELEND